MEKNLKSVKLVAQILKIICLIGFICCVIGAVGGLIGAITVGAFWGDENIRKLVFDTSGVDIPFKVALCSCICATIICVVSAIVVWFAYKLYEEIKLSETPFNRKVAKDMLNLGILHLIMAVGSAIVCGIIMLCFGADVDVSNGDMFLIYRLGDEIVDPDTKEILGTLEIVVGMGKVEHAQETIATLTSCKTKKAKSKTIRKLPWSMGSEEIVEEPEFLPFNEPRIGDFVKRL